METYRNVCRFGAEVYLRADDVCGKIWPRAASEVPCGRSHERAENRLESAALTPPCKRRQLSPPEHIKTNCNFTERDPLMEHFQKLAPTDSCAHRVTCSCKVWWNSVNGPKQRRVVHLTTIHCRLFNVNLSTPAIYLPRFVQSVGGQFDGLLSHWQPAVFCK